jgi:GntR family transcriptional regulator
MMEQEGPRFAPRGRRLVYVQVADVIAARIEDGTYPPEARLPPETEFVAEFGCSRESVRRAIQELRSRGLIETVAGKGSYVLPESERNLQRET